MRYILLLLLFTFSLSAQNTPKRPNPPRLVNDLAGILSEAERANLERKLVLYNDSTSTQIVVVTINTTGDYAVDQVALNILHDWGVGDKKKDNGIVILAAVDDRHVNIQTGYGMEGALPDALCGRIIDRLIVPNFKQKKYYEGFNQATDAIIERAKGEYKNDNIGEEADAGSVLIFLLVVGIFIFVIIYSNRNNRGMMVTRRGYGNWDGGGWRYIGGGGGGWDNSDRGGGGGFDFGGFGGGDGGGGGASGEW
jgi:uncharacterized protein